VLAVLLAAACATGRLQEIRAPADDGARTLPAHRDAVIRYAALGDSTVEGVGATRADLNYVGRLHERLRAVYPAARVTNLGASGATSADVLRRQLTRAIALAPHLVTLSIGPNDITTRVPAAAYDRNLDAILGRLRAETTAVVVVNLIPDLVVTPRFRAHRERDALAWQTVLFNEVLKRRGRAYGAELVDLYAASQREVPARPELVGPDGYHPSDVGYARWAELVWAGIRARIPYEVGVNGEPSGRVERMEDREG
jgi:acyl-CoA thioesterase I